MPMPPRDRAEDIVITVGSTFVWIVFTTGFVLLLIWGPNREAPSWPLGAVIITALFLASTVGTIWWWKGYLKQLKQKD